MREKLLNLMKTEQLTASKLAELLGIQPSGISHILSGRNKPSFDLVQKILRRFPQINPDWLLLDNGDMYRSTATPISKTENSTEELQKQGASNMTTPATGDGYTSNAESVSSSAITNSVAAVSTKHGNVKRVIILFEDHTFESFEMQR